jgi:3-methylcrotonyl-CoA carboxylase alpha subunit
MRKFKKILIANRGEIACRIIRTCRAMGIEAIAVYSDADKTMPFVTLANKAIPLQGNEAKDTYLNIPKLIEICRQEQIDAVHPGYGFLSENADFASELAKAGVVFMGPSPKAIQAMGSKSEAKQIADTVGVPIIRGYMGDNQDPQYLLAQAKEIGFPVLIKATHGGGGKGMRRVNSESEFMAALEGCQREALNAFSNATVMVEKYIVDPRHIEIQVFGDSHGTVVTLAERDCSLQRRHQKIIEEAPAIGLSDATRAGLHKDAITLAQAVQYQGAGTVEFLVDANGDYYFLEMNTRLQVEHPVTEMITSQDLVQWQIIVAQGGQIPLSQDQISAKGHAIEARIYAEDPYQGFLPSIGKITQFDCQDTTARFDSGYKSGNQVSIYYDPMLAKLIVHGKDRTDAIQHLIRALICLKIAGVKTNREFLIELMQNPDVCNALPHIAYLDRSMETLLATPELTDNIKDCLALDFINARKTAETSPWSQSDSWRHMSGNTQAVRFDYNGVTYRHQINTQCTTDSYLAVDSTTELVRLSINGKVYTATSHNPDHLHLEDNGSDQSLNAPMPGRIISVIANRGESVDAGAPLLILEAMKMEHTIRAPHNGIVEEILFKTGDFVSEGEELVKMNFKNTSPLEGGSSYAKASAGCIA